MVVFLVAIHCCQVMFCFLFRANISLEKPKEELKSRNTVVKDDNFRTSNSPNLHSQATVYAKLAESDAVKTGSLKSSAEQENLKDESGLFVVLPISAESTGMLPSRKAAPCVEPPLPPLPLPSFGAFGLCFV
ncbi:uncharacterized protein LOC110746977 [Prunus avium]|uniref:Uncharacterized protein LOC110746977 n=1 Tax=Prunus avium TaxID=42229 RepID=A0A6P5RPE2_PRUAV|nr:uncharacterized protein LOC110746977 [Prunus avium]